MFLKNRNKIKLTHILLAILPGLLVVGFLAFANSNPKTIFDESRLPDSLMVIDASDSQKETIIGSQLFELIELVWPDAQGYIYNEGSYEQMWTEGYRQGLGGQGKLPDHLYAYAEQSPSIQEWTWVTNLSLDLTGYDSVKIDAYSPNVGGAKTLLAVSGNKDGKHDEADASVSIMTGVREIFTLDVSGLSGEYYIRIHVRTAGRGNSNYYRCYKVWLE